MIDQALINAALKDWQIKARSQNLQYPGSLECNAFHDGLKEGIRLANEAIQPTISNLEASLGEALQIQSN